MVEQSYFALSPYFDAWVRTMEMGTRRMEVEEMGAIRGRRILIIAPPTDAGTPALARANESGETIVLAFSARNSRISSDYLRKRGAGSLTDVQVAPFFQLPFTDACFNAIYANCFFDFCSAADVGRILGELHRVLDADGTLCATYMGLPGNLAARGWAWLFGQFPSLSQGCHPVSLDSYLVRHDFSGRTDLSLTRFGFPLQYTVAVKGERVSPGAGRDATS